jgi:hypothetical protein
MPIVRFAWSPLLVDVRREQCPRAKWDRAHRAWTMTQAEADRFLVLQLRIVPVSIVGAPGLFVVLDAPREPLPKQLARLWSQENSAGEDMTDGVHGHTKLW